MVDAPLRDVEFPNPSVTLGCVIVPFLSWPVTTVSIVLVIISILLAASVLLHKGRGGGMGDLFGGGASSAMGGVSTAERRLDKITVVLSAVWIVTIAALLALYYVGA